jgi:hypothetical protein
MFSAFHKRGFWAMILLYPPIRTRVPDHGTPS